MLIEQKEIIQCYCLPSKTPTVDDLLMLLKDALPYADDAIAYEMQKLMDVLPQMTDADIAEAATSIVGDVETQTAPWR